MGDRCAGRDRELATLRVALGRASKGRGGVVVVSGPAGIGKSALVDAFIGEDAHPSSTVITGRCLDQPGTPAYWPWRRVLRTIEETRGPGTLREALGAQLWALRPLLPEGWGDTAGDGGAGSGEPDGRFRIYDAMTGLLRRLSRTETVVVVLEDLQWADEGSLGLLACTVNEVRDARVLIVATWRDEPRYARAAADVIRQAQRITLRGLDRHAIGLMVAATLGEEAPPTLVDRLVRTTGGNPFFCTEILHALGEHPAGDADVPLALPDTIRDSVRAHLEPLDAVTRDVLGVCAVVGDTVELGLVSEAAEMAAGVVVERLGTAVDHGVLVDEGRGRWHFAHALVRDTIYGDLAAMVRMRHHARVGTILESGVTSGEVPAGVLAHHFLHAAPLGTGAKAVTHATRAAREASALAADRDAVAAYERALGALGVVANDRGERLTLRLEAAETARRAGMARWARDRFLEAAQDARAIGDGMRLAIAAAGYYQVSPNLTGPDPRTVPLLMEGLAALDTSDSLLRLMLLTMLGTPRYGRGDAAERDGYGSEAVAMARRIAEPRALASVLIARQLAVVGPGSPAGRLTLADEVIELVAAGATETEYLGRAARFHALVELGRLGPAVAELDRLSELAERHRRADNQAGVLVRRAMLALMEGRFDDGAGLAAQALARRRDTTDATPFQAFVLQMFLARRDTTQHGGLEGSLRFLVDQYPAAPMWRAVLGVFLADAGREAEARTVFEVLAANDFAAIDGCQNEAAVIAWMARLCAFVRDVPRAAALRRRLMPYADQHVVLGPESQASLGSMHRYVGLVAWTGGDFDGARDHFERAIEANAQMGARPIVACCQHELGRLLAMWDRPGDRAQASVLIGQARATAQVCGMHQLLEWIDRLGPIEVAPVVAETAPSASTVPASLRRDGDVWVVGFGDASARVKDARGVHLLAVLLRHPGQEMHVLDLASGRPGESRVDAVGDRGDAGPMLDRAARAAYKQRLDDLRDDLDEAERFNDPERATRARHEMEFLAEELARGVGLGGRDRRAASAAERARINATRTIGGVIKKIAALHPRLGEHLRATVRTGTFCVYAPDPSSPIRWTW